jgi:hypothetical protein
MGSQNTDSRLHFSKEDFPAGHLDQGFAKKVGEAVWRQPDLLPLSLIPRLIFFLVQLEASGLFPFFTSLKLFNNVNSVLFIIYKEDLIHSYILDYQILQT